MIRKSKKVTSENNGNRVHLGVRLGVILFVTRAGILVSRCQVVLASNDHETLQDYLNGFRFPSLKSVVRATVRYRDSYCKWYAVLF